MHGWLGMAMIPIGIGMAVAASMKLRNRLSVASPAGQIRPEFAAMGEIMRPIVLFVIGIFAAEMILLYFVFGGQRFMTPLDFGGIMFVLLAYTGYVLVATRKQVEAPDSEARPEVQTAA
jgi:hypothetical protein